MARGGKLVRLSLFALLAYLSLPAGALDLGEESLPERVDHELERRDYAAVTATPPTLNRDQIRSEVSAAASALAKVESQVQSIEAVLQRLLSELGGVPVGFPTPSPSSTEQTQTSSSRASTTTLKSTSTLHVTKTTTTVRSSTKASSKTSSKNSSKTSSAASSKSSSKAASSKTSSAPSTSATRFDLLAVDNIAAYYDFTTVADRKTTMDSMQQLCDDPAINIIYLAFLSTRAGVTPSGGVAYSVDYPCGSVNCTAIGSQARLCRSKGKKVLLSLNVTQPAPTDNSTAAPVQPSDDAARSAAFRFADALASSFVAGGGAWTLPDDDGAVSAATFGDLVVDGFDVYHAGDPRAAGAASNPLLVPDVDYLFLERLRAAMDYAHGLLSSGARPPRTHLLSATAPCTLPSAALQPATLRILDLINIRYFGGPDACAFDDPRLDLAANLAAWDSAVLQSYDNSPPNPPALQPNGTLAPTAVDDGQGAGRIFLAAQAPDFSSAGVSNVTVARWEDLAAALNPQNVPQQGGVALAGSPGAIEARGRSGRTFAAYVKGQVGCVVPGGQVVVACGNATAAAAAKA